MKRERQDELYQECLHMGIVMRMEFEINYGTEDLTAEFTYLADRYTAEYGRQDGMADHELEKKLEEYKEAVKKRAHDRG